VQARQTVLGRGRDHLAPARAGLDAGGAGIRVDADPAQQTRAQQDRAGQIRQTGGTVTGRLRGDPQVVRRREPHGRGDVRHPICKYDQGRMLVGGEIPGLPRLVPTGVSRGHDIAGDRLPQRLEVDHSTSGHGLVSIQSAPRQRGQEHG
jgi:hypothetical protein